MPFSNTSMAFSNRGGGYLVTLSEGDTGVGEGEKEGMR